MFYIADDPTVIFPFVGLNVYDRNNNVMGTLQGFVTDRTSELSIVPFPDNDGCSINKYYIFYSSPNPLNLSAELRDYIVDMNGNGNLGTMSGPNTVLSIPTSEWAGIAVGQQSNGIRFLYFSGGSVFGTRNIEKVTIAASGLTHQNIFTDNSHFWDFETSVSVRPSTYCLIIFHDVNS